VVVLYLLHDNGRVGFGKFSRHRCVIKHQKFGFGIKHQRFGCSIKRQNFGSGCNIQNIQRSTVSRQLLQTRVEPTYNVFCIAANNWWWMANKQRRRPCCIVPSMQPPVRLNYFAFYSDMTRLGDQQFVHKNPHQPIRLKFHPYDRVLLVADQKGIRWVNRVVVSLSGWVFYAGAWQENW